MPSPIQHPVLGNLVPDQWDANLMTFREFPHMKTFWFRETDISGVEPEHQKWLDNWQNHTEELAEICRNGEIFAWLQSRGIYEVSVEIPDQSDDTPSEEQVAAFEYFTKHEQTICANATDAILRYYHHCIRDLMIELGDDDFPEDPTIDELGELVAFDGFEICRCSSGDVSPLMFSWDPEWDPEHGMRMLVFRDQVIGIGTDELDELISEPAHADEFGMWGTEQMTDAERAALKEYIENFEPSEDF